MRHPVLLLTTPRHPWLWLALVALVAAAATALFPATPAAGCALLAAVAGAGGGAAWVTGLARPPFVERALRSLEPHVALAESALVAASVLAASAIVFRGPWSHGGFNAYDWAPHHANLRHLVDGLAAARVPRWSLGASTGDATFELYPLLPYYLAARAALALGISDLTLVLVRSGILVHTLFALGAGLLARRLLGFKWGIVVGLVALFDVGSVFGGGADGVIKLGVTHSALANAIWTFVLLGIVSGLERPRLVVSVAVTLLAALAALCHPLALVAALATLGALGAVAVLAEDVPAHRALVAAGQVALGIALAAFVWRPLAARLVLYGVHYAAAGENPAAWIRGVLAHSVPEATFEPFVYAGYAGVAVGLWSRRAGPTLLACHAALLFAGLFDQLYLVLHLLPSLDVSRLQVVRFASCAKVSIYVLGAYALASLFRGALPRALATRRVAAGALTAVLAFPLCRGGLEYATDLTAELARLAHPDVPDADGFRALIAWAKARAHEERPDAFARLLSTDRERFYSVCHVEAVTGLPAVWPGSVPAVFLRERIEDTSPASLARFDVRWVVEHGASPPIGDPATERHFGSYVVRDVPGWDGRFARIERGHGDVVVTRLEDELVEVELRNTTEPALVALGMGYYPRWRAVHDARGELSTYAYPATPGGSLHVLAAWLPPGRTVFRPNGALPSDTGGRALSLGALLLGLAGITVWSRAGLRQAALRAMARGKRALRRHLWQVLRGLGLVGVAVLLLAGWWFARAPAGALIAGTGLVPLARVEERHGGEFVPCPYSLLEGRYRCPSGAGVVDTAASLVNDAPPSTPLVTPAVRLEARGSATELRASWHARLGGEYWGKTNGPRVSLRVGTAAPVALDGRQVTLSWAPASSPATAVLTATLGAQESVEVTVAKRTRLEPDRGYPEPPPRAPWR